MSEVNEESFESRLDSLGQIDRCDVACGSYGDKFHRWDDAGPYVEYEDHVKHVSFYADELDAQRQRADTAEADLKAMGERYQKDLLLSRERWCYGNRADAKLAAAEQKISELVAAFTPLIKHWDDLATGESANVDRARKALNSNPEAESHE